MKSATLIGSLTDQIKYGLLRIVRALRFQASKQLKAPIIYDLAHAYSSNNLDMKPL